MRWLGLLVSSSVACAATEPAPHRVEHVRTPRIERFGRTFAVTNDALPELEVAFRELERGMARHHCPECHSDEPGPHPMAFASNAFELRHNIVVVLEANVMPAADRDGSVGIADETERLSLLARARAFEAAGDAALTRDIEP